MSSEEELKLKIQSIHKNLLGTHLDQKSLRFWVHAVMANQDKINEFSSMLLNSAEYKQVLYKQYREVYIDLVGFDINIDEFDAFYESEKGKVVPLVKIRKYLFTLPSTLQKYTDLIKSTYMLKTCTECSDEIVQFYIDKFALNEAYDLVEAIDCSEHLPPKQVTTNAVVQEPAPDLRLDALLNLMGASDLDHALQVASIPVKTCSMRTDQIALFESVFKRPIFVQEYFKYVNSETSFDISTLQALFAITRQTFNKVRELYLDYMRQEIDEYYFIKLYLYDYESPDFYEQIVEQIIQSELYAQHMKATLSSSYKEMFDETLDEHDILYIFDRVKAAKLPVTSDEIRESLTDLKKETDNIISNLFEKYQEVLHRQPDIYEVDEMIVMYRAQLTQGIAFLNGLLEKRLMSSLEFHDIIKQKIRSSYITLHDREPLPSQVFAVLNGVIKQITSDTTLERCCSIIETLCK